MSEFSFVTDPELNEDSKATGLEDGEVCVSDDIEPSRRFRLYVPLVFGFGVTGPVLSSRGLLSLLSVSIK
jgi:hypothetical protein